MTLATLRAYLESKPGNRESFPFDEKTLVLKVGGKMYALVSITQPDFVNLKCDPDRALELRASNPGITPGYHMDKKHWNSVSLLGEVDDEDILELIDHSYHLVVNSLPEKKRREIDNEKPVD